MISAISSIDEVKSEYVRTKLPALMTRASEARVAIYLFDSIDSALDYEQSCIEDELPYTLLADPLTREYIASACVI